MVKAITAFGLLALSALGAATPTPESDIVHSDFSFAQWVEDIIADPDTALSPEQAIQAHNATLTARSLDKRQSRVNCDQITLLPAGEAEAVWCINYLADKGRNGENCPVTCSATPVCQWYQCNILTQGPTCDQRSVNCNQVARAAGAIMDQCWRADHTVAGNAFAPAPDDWVYVHLQGPSAD